MSSFSSSSSLKEEKKHGDDSLPWIEKYRPCQLKDLISNMDVLETITRLAESNALPHLLFYGPPGTGKTSTILALARKLHGSHFRSMVLELNASDDRGIQVVREKIREFAESKTLFQTGLKLVILDEADSMTGNAQDALRRVIEQFTKNTRFCLIGNYINKIKPALQSRCTRFRFGPLETKQVTKRLEWIAEQERVTIHPDGLSAIVKIAHGDMRKCLNILQASALINSTITSESVHKCVGTPSDSDIQQIMKILVCPSFTISYAHAEILRIQTERGLALTDIVQLVHEQVLVMNLHASVLALVLEQLANIEFRLASATSEKLELGAMIGLFYMAHRQQVSYNKKIIEKKVDAAQV